MYSIAGGYASPSSSPAVGLVPNYRTITGARIQATVESGGSLNKHWEAPVPILESANRSLADTPCQPKNQADRYDQLYC